MKLFRYTLVFILVCMLSSVFLHGQVQIDSVSSTPTLCGDSDDGTITVYVSGGTGSYNYNLSLGASTVESSGDTTSTEYTFTGHEQSIFYIIIVEELDAGGGIVGIASTNASIVGPKTISIKTTTLTDMTCHDVPNGTITVTAEGEGDDNFKFDLAGPDGPQSNPIGIFNGLQAGTTHQVTVWDGDGCPTPAITPPLTINNPSEISLTDVTVVDVACFGDNTGSISIQPTGGTPGGGGTGYTYSWTGPSGFSSTAEDISGLEAGDYFVTVFDINMCTFISGAINVDQSSDLTASLTGSTDVTCNAGNDGTASMNPGGGAGGYSYSWDGQLSGLISTDQNPTDLVADTYDFTLFDALGCSKTITDFAIIDEPAPFAVNVVGTTDVKCSGGLDGSAEILPSGGGPTPYSFLWTGIGTGHTATVQDPLTLRADTYDLEITDAAGICSQLFPNLITIDEPNPIVVTLLDSSEVSCFDGADGSATISISGGTPTFNFLWTGVGTGHTSFMENPNNLRADTYNLSVTDGNGCPLVIMNMVIIEEPDDLSVTVDNVTNVDCNGDFTGSIQITPGGGTPNYTYAWSGPNGFSESTKDISNLEAGDYSLTITDSRGCTKDFTDVATVGTNTSISALFDPTHISCNGGSDGAINATVSGGTPDYTYAWIGSGGFTADTEDISGVPVGTYRLTVTDDLGCIEVMADQLLTEPPLLTAIAVTVHIDCS